MKLKSTEGLKTLGLALFLGGGLLLVHAGALPLWLWGILTALMIFLRWLPRIDPYRDEVVVSDQGIVRQHGSRLRRTSTESVRWDELWKVDLLTGEPVPGGLLFLLYGEGSNGVAIPGQVAQQHGLVPLLQRRLPGFDAEPVTTAADQPARTTLWEKARPQA